MRLLGAALLALALGGADGWRSHAPLPVPRTEVAAATLGRDIAVVGGYVASGGSSNEVDFYSPSSDAWRRGPDLPAGVNHAAAAVARGRLYVVGGYGAERSAFVLDDGAWRTLSLPASRAAAGAAALRGVVYAVGGVGQNGNARTMLAYDTRTGRWQTMPGPSPRQHLAVTAARGRIYAIAGRVTGLNTNFRLVESWAPGERRCRRETRCRSRAAARAPLRSATRSSQSAERRPAEPCAAFTRTTSLAEAGGASRICRRPGTASESQPSAAPST